jgi:hypothetical protein
MIGIQVTPYKTYQGMCLMPHYTIPAQNLGRLEESLEKLNKKAKKLKTPAITLKILERREVKRQDWTGLLTWLEVYYLVEVEGVEPVKEGGWEFLATIQHLESGNIVRKVPGTDEIDTKAYRHTPPHCDHCKQTRDRKDTYLVKSGEGEIKQLGKTCIKDFLGHGDPEAIARELELYTHLELALSDAEDLDEGGRYRETHYELKQYLSFVAEAVKLYGWVSRANSTPWKIATATVVEMNLAALRSPDSRISEKAFRPGDESIQEASHAIAWGRETFSLDLND